jgi:hypothetical protein
LIIVKAFNFLTLLDKETKKTIESYTNQYKEKVDNEGWPFQQFISPEDICLARNKVNGIWQCLFYGSP